MTLLELCEPLFQYICRMNRSARKGVGAEPAQIRSEVKLILSDLRTRAATDRALVTQYDRVELPLLFFVDFMVREALGGKGWTELASERKELAGDERFFDLLDETLKESGEAANERLAVFYTCLGLGFTGWYTGQPEFLRRKMVEISARTRGLMDTEQRTRICPESYEHVNTQNFITPPGRKLVGVAIALVGLVLVVMAANVSLYFQSKSKLTESLRRVPMKAEPAERSSGAGADGVEEPVALGAVKEGSR